MFLRTLWIPSKSVDGTWYSMGPFVFCSDDCRDDFLADQFPLDIMTGNFRFLDDEMKVGVCNRCDGCNRRLMKMVR